LRKFLLMILSTLLIFSGVLFLVSCGTIEETSIEDGTYIQENIEATSDSGITEDVETVAEEDVGTEAEESIVIDDTEQELEEIPTYTVSFDSYYGSEIPNQTVDESTLITMPIDVSKDGYSFIEWCKKEDNQLISWDFDSDVVVCDMILYAKWEANNYEITLNCDGGLLDDDIQLLDIVYDSSFEISVPNKDNYNFLGWFYNDEAITDSNGLGINNYCYLEGIELQAQYSRITIDDGKFIYTLNDDDSTSYKIWGISQSNLSEVLEIPESYNSMKVTAIEEEAFKGMNSLTSVIVPNSMLTIGKGAFSGCSGITSITLPFIGSSRDVNNTEDSVLGYIFGEDSYEEASEIEQIYKIEEISPKISYYIPNSLSNVIITEATVVPTGAFSCCTMIASIVMNEGIIDINSYAFSNCKNLAIVNIPISVTNIGTYAFNSCESLLEIMITKTVITIEIFAFANCDNLSIECNFDEEECNWEKGWDDLDILSNKVNVTWLTA
jgi:hypothetical protein